MADPAAALCSCCPKNCTAQCHRLDPFTHGTQIKSEHKYQCVAARHQRKSIAPSRNQFEQENIAKRATG